MSFSLNSNNQIAQPLLSQQQQQQQATEMHDSQVSQQHCQLSIDVMDVDPMCEDYVDDERDLETFEGIAFQSRLENEKLSADETQAFPEVVNEEKLFITYITIRNSILKLWLQNPKTQLLIETVFLEVKPPENCDSIFISRVFCFLERFGFINFGVFQLSAPSKVIQSPKPKIVVIGAGIAGLNAARQLKYFGFDVTVLEARNRIGGRIFTYKFNKCVADVGAKTIVGLTGNPLRVLNKQIEIKMLPIKDKCPLYMDNELVSPDHDEIIERMFNQFLDDANTFRQNDSMKISPHYPTSLGAGIECILQNNERKVFLKHQSVRNRIIQLYELIKEKSQKCIQIQETLKVLSAEHEKRNKVKRLPVEEFAFRRNKLDILENIEQHKQYFEQIKKLREKVKVLEDVEFHVYMNAEDKRSLNWHFANLEFATGTQLNNLSLTDWDQDEQVNPQGAFHGDHLVLENGYCVLPNALIEGLDHRLNSCVRQIKILPHGVEIQVSNIQDKSASSPYSVPDSASLSKKLSTSSSQTFVADAVLCTLPLGVLKNSVEDFDEEFPSPNKIEFSPPLPDAKIQSIKNLGMGNWNKVVLVFDQIFWRKDVQLFGNVNDGPVSNRGELFLFWAVSKHPVLITLISGESADRMEKVDDETIKKKVLDTLQGIFKTTSTLKNFYVSKWKSDPWSMGVYSYVSTQATGKDYDVLAEPIALPTKSDKPNNPRLFFAGEHTSRNYPATVHGAFLSGIREATRIANQFLGISYSQPKKM